MGAPGTVGWYSYDPELSAVPSGVVTLTATLPTARAGATAVICVSSRTVNDVATSGPKFTAVAPVKLRPVMMTLVPPVAGPAVGVNDVTAVGGRTAWSSAAALMMPAPHVLDGEAASHKPPGNAVAWAGLISRASTCAGVRVGDRESMSATTPATCGVAMLVPLYDEYVGVAGVVPPELRVDQMPLPGAAISTVDPKLENDARAPVDVVAATVTTPVQLAGVKPAVSELLLPAATTTIVPRPRASLIAVCVEESQLPVPPRDRLITRAGVGLAGSPETLPPEAQMMPAAISEV